MVKKFLEELLADVRTSGLLKQAVAYEIYAIDGGDSSPVLTKERFSVVRHSVAFTSAVGCLDGDCRLYHRPQFEKTGK